jgi:hypothetical protein
LEKYQGEGGFEVEEEKEGLARDRMWPQHRE